MDDLKRTIVVVGAGVSGLAFAHRLQFLARREGRPLRTLVLEASPRAGGVIDTVERDGFLLENGPDSFLSEEPGMFELCRELGIEKELIETQPRHRRTSIVRRGRLVPLPEGFYLIAPKNVPAFLGTPLFSLPGKLRMLAEPLVPPRRGPSDESVASFIRRRFGKEALERAGQPMIAGVHSGDPEKLSMRSVMPRFCRAEQESGSVLRGLRAPERTSGVRYSLFMSFARGMRTLSAALERSLEAGSLRTGFRTASLERSSGRWTVRSEKGEAFSADAVCLAVPARVSAALLRSAAPEAAALLGRVRYESVATLNLAFDADAFARPLDSFGFVAPSAEGLSLAACTFAHRKFAGRAAGDKALLRVFAGGAFGRRWLGLSDAELEAAALKDLEKLLGLRKKPLFSVLRRHTDALPQYELGHAALVEALEAARPEGLWLTGSSLRGTGIPDCVRDARRCAGEAL